MHFCRFDESLWCICEFQPQFYVNRVFNSYIQNESPGNAKPVLCMNMYNTYRRVIKQRRENGSKTIPKIQ